MRLLYTIVFTVCCFYALHAQDSTNTAGLMPVVAQPGFTTIHGSIVDVLTKQPLSKVSISIRNFRARTIETSGDTFQINVPSPYAILIFSYPGYQTKEVALSGNTSVRVALVKEGVNVGESQVKLPYYTEYENNLNGSYHVIAKTQDKIEENPSVFQMVQGTVPGLSSTNYSGVPEEGAFLDIRGTHSLFATNNPLIVVDGFPISNTVVENPIIKGNVYNFLSDLNVKDIESITVLRDAAAVGIYGSRASNGAIVIQTSSGTSGKTLLDFTSQVSMGEKFKDIPMMDATSYSSFLSNKLYQQGYTSNEINQSYPFFTGTQSQTSEYWRYANNTNWQDEVKQTSFSQDYYLGLRGGDGTSKYLFSVGYKDQSGNIKGVDVNRINTRFNLDFKLLKKLSVGTRVYYSKTHKNLMDQGYDEANNPLYISLVKPSILAPYLKNSLGQNTPVYDNYTFDGLSNPLAITNNVENNMDVNWLVGNVYLNYEILKNLSTKVNMGLDWRNTDVNRFLPSEGRVVSSEGYIRSSEQELSKATNVWVEHTLSYEKTFNYLHHLRVYGGYNFETSKLKSDYGLTVNSPSDDFTGLGNGTKIKVDGENISIHGLALFGNVDYDFKNKVTLTIGTRIDGSSRFGKNADAPLKFSNSPFAVLPYGGIAWKLSSEPWMRGLRFVDELKLRASAGITANQDIDPSIGYSTYESKYYSNGPGLIPSGMANSSIKWETNYNYDGGLDFSTFNKALRLQLDYFYTKTTDLLAPVAVDGTTGSSFYWSNGGEMENSGIEAGVSTMGKLGKLNWNVGFNIATSKNKITKLPGGKPVISDYYGYKSIAIVGKAAGLFYGYKSLGVFASDAEAEAANLTGNNGQQFKGGDFHYEDIDNNNQITDADMQVIGDPNPDFYGGIYTGFSYANFDLDAQFSFSYGNDVMNVLRSKLETAKGYENQSVAVGSMWKENGDLTSIANTPYRDPMNNRRASSNWVEDGSYFKLRALTLAYNINKRLAFVRNARVFVSCYNVFTATKYLGWDPEVRTGVSVFTRGYDFGNMPATRTLLLGIKLGL